ncbi:pseudouridine synthase [Perkinsela sp. CCAP 1560/4]|nr:pseudouridine synthase [Perkinsela sp. CCAP 1560/4]|eukprot:KNH05498.1 pseudouridine synthase [Perkinsela sp. CCAP 1560/4]
MLNAGEYFAKIILPRLQGFNQKESLEIVGILQRSPAVVKFKEGTPCCTAYNALLQNMGTVHWVAAMKLYNHLFFAKGAECPKSSISKPNLQTARVVLNILFRSANWQLATRHFFNYCFPRFRPDEAAYNAGKLYNYLQDQHAHEMAYRVLEQSAQHREIKFNSALSNALFRTDLVTWSANLRVLTILYEKDKNLIEIDHIHQVLMLCVRSLQWKRCMQLVSLSEEINTKISSPLLLRVAKLFFKGNRWSLSSHILSKCRANSSDGNTSVRLDKNVGPAERRDQASMLALARMWVTALQLVRKEPIEVITHTLQMAGAWECAMRFCCGLPCMNAEADGHTTVPLQERILRIPWKVVENCVLAGKYENSARQSAIALLKPFCLTPMSTECWKLALSIANINHLEIIKRLPVESQLLDMKFFPVTHRIHPSLRYRILFPLVLNYLRETGIITDSERAGYFTQFYPQLFHCPAENAGSLHGGKTSPRWMFALVVLTRLFARREKAPIQLPTFNQLMVTLSHLTNVPYLTVLKGHIDRMKLSRLGQTPNPEGTLKSFVYGGYLADAFHFIRLLREWNVSISVECMMFAVSTMVLPGISLGQPTRRALHPDDAQSADPESSGTIVIPVRVRDELDRKMLNDYVRMYQFSELIQIDKKHKHYLHHAGRFPSLIHVLLNTERMGALQTRTAIHHPDVLTLYSSPHTAVVLKPTKLESIAHAANREPSGVCPDLTSAIRWLFPETSTVRSFGLTHRLDIQTSGVLVVAKSQPAFHHITQQSLTRQKRKRYLCVCIQVDPSRSVPDSGTITTRFSDMRDDSHRMSVEGDTEAETHYMTLRKFRCMMRLVECTLVTGRQHQIRVHLGKIGFVLLGDDRYGCGLAATPLVDRVALHAKEIGFWEPSGDGFCLVEATLPPDLDAVLDRLGQMESSSQV